LVNFGIKLSEYNGSKEPKTPKDWQAAFLQLKNYLNTLEPTEKKVIFIDELPWIYTPRSSFLQLLAHFWNDYLSKKKHFILIVCGSATSWITKKVINDPGGLHNRVTEIIHLHPFTIAETKSFLTSKGLRFSDQEIAKIYMVLGGIPFYLENLRKGESFPVAIERICFSPKGLLHNEYRNLYQALFKNSDLHQSIVAVLAARQYGMTRKELLQELNHPSTGTFQRSLEELMVSDFVIESIPFGKKKRGSFYRLVDEYSIFYHRFIKPNRRFTDGIWLQLSSSQSYKIWTGFAFELLCFKHINVIKKALGISAVYTEISSLRIPATEITDGFQVDLLIDRKDDAINICEVKFYASTFTINKTYYQQLLQKRDRFIQYTGTKKQVFLTFITNHGLTNNAYAREVVDVTLTLEHIMQA